jgi:3'(2'), 5'-bisphosphate nucleotidase
MPYEQELQAALRAAALAGKLIMEHYATFQVIPNAPVNISTDTDRQSQETILQSLHQTFPQDALRAEENTPSLAKVAGTGPRLWIIDPIDGTRGFARKNGEFSVMVAFMDQGRIAVGVVLEPATDRLTYAVRGGGCWQHDGTRGGPQPCHVTSTSELTQATVIQSHTREPSRHIQALRPAQVVETYSAGIKLARVARGEADLYLNTYDACSDWDICAGQILVEEAGGRVTNLRGQEPRYGQPRALQPHGLLAGNPRLHEVALAALRPVEMSGPA